MAHAIIDLVKASSTTRMDALKTRSASAPMLKNTCPNKILNKSGQNIIKTLINLKMVKRRKILTILQSASVKIQM